MITKDSKELSEGNFSIKTETAKTQTCSECGSTRIVLDYENNEIVCMDCEFIVHQKIIDKKSEKKNVRGKQQSKCAKAETHLTYTIHDKGSTTVIDWHDRGIYDKTGSSSQKAQVYHLRGWQRRIRTTDSVECNLAFALSEITKIANQLNLPKSILETASVIYRKVVKEKIIRGRSIQSVVAAVLYLVCRQCGLPRTLDEIAQVTAVNKKEAGKCYRCLIKELDYSAPLVLSKSTQN
jgi:transcription initiation factor TFIIB